MLSTIYLDDLYKVDDNTVSEIIKVIYSDKPNVFISLPDNNSIVKEYNSLYIKNKDEKNDIIINDLYYEDKNIIIKEVDKSNDTSNYTIRLNTNELSMPLKFKYRNNGDKMWIKNNKGYKKLKDIFIDLKIPQSKRDSIPILYDNNNEVLWVPMFKKSKYDKDINDDYNLVLKCEKK